MSNDIMALVGAAFGRLLGDGVGVAEQERQDVLQAGYVGALEAARRWVPEEGGFSTFITECARGAMLDHLNTEARGGIGSRDSEPLTRYGEADVTDIDETVGERLPLGDRQVYDWTPQGFDPEVEAEAMMVRRKVAKLPAEEAKLIDSLFGLSGPETSMATAAHLRGTDRKAIWRRANAAMTRLGYRESVAPDGWAEYRETAFRKGAGATKASQSRGVIAGRPYRRGHTSLYDPIEHRITRASNRKAWLAAGRRANGLPG